MRIGVPRETAAGERRVALVPEVVAKLVEAGHRGRCRTRRGRRRVVRGHRVRGGRRALADSAWDAEAVAKVQKPSADEAARLRRGSVLIGVPRPPHRPRGDRAARRAGRDRLRDGVDSAHHPRAVDGRAVFAGDGRAATRRALIAADRLPRFLPMLTTAAGTIQPAKVLVIGAGVAGLQAIATARRLGAVVSGFDVRAGRHASRSSRSAPSSSTSASAARRPRAATRRS